MENTMIKKDFKEAIKLIESLEMRAINAFKDTGFVCESCFIEVDDSFMNRIIKVRNKNYMNKYDERYLICNRVDFEEDVNLFQIMFKDKMYKESLFLGAIRINGKIFCSVTEFMNTKNRIGDFYCEKMNLADITSKLKVLIDEGKETENH